MKFDNLRLDNQLCFALYSATNNITRVYRKLLDEHDLTYPQYLVLVVLWEQDGIAIKDVMQRLNLDSGTLSPIIKRLQQAKLVNKVRSEHDERIVHLYLTDKAKDLEPSIADIQHQVACATALSTDEFRELLGTLHKLADTLNMNTGKKTATG